MFNIDDKYFDELESAILHVYYFLPINEWHCIKLLERPFCNVRYDFFGGTLHMVDRDGNVLRTLELK
jgi:hypothetical protein